MSVDRTAFGARIPLHDELVAPLHGLTLKEAVRIGARIDALCAHLAMLGLERVTSSYDFARLHWLNRDKRDKGYHPLMPSYDFMLGPIDAHEGFWISVGTETSIMATIAVRLREVRSNLLEAWIDGSFMTDRPELGITGAISGPIARIGNVAPLTQIRGEIAVPGAMWVDPACRGLRLSETLFALAVLLAYRRWKPPHFVGLLELATENRVGHGSYGFPWGFKFFTFDMPGSTLKAQGDEISMMLMSQTEARELFIDTAVLTKK